MAKKRGRSFERPDGQIRRSQLITTYGPGALVDLLHDSVLISGLDLWKGSRDEDKISEPRLAAKLASALNQSGEQHIDVTDAFRAPPAGEDSSPNRQVGIDAVEFPSWFVCQNRECRSLVRAADGLIRKGNRWVHDCTPRGSECVPVRFVSACEHGHIDEFPWVSFVHLGSDDPDHRSCRAPSLQLTEGATG